MAQNRPNKPSVTLPDNFGGVKSEFSSTRISNGYESSTPEIVEGGNLNYMLDGLFQNTKYMRTVLDYVRDTPVGRMFWVNSSGQMDYIQPAVIATNTEFNTGTATDKTPNVKQVVDKLETKATPANITSAINTMLSSLYPVGSLYIGTQTTCPLTSLISGSTWTLVAANKALWTGTGSNANTTIAAGLPNITGKITPKIYVDKPIGLDVSGCFVGSDTGKYSNPDGGGDLKGNRARSATLSASNSNSIYGNSSTVQPPAYVVNVWRRTA